MKLGVFSGRIGKDPTERFTPAGDAINSFSIAVNQGKKQADGTWTDEAYWIDIAKFGKLPANVAKGANVLVHGEIKFFTHSKDGVDRKWFEVIANSIEVLSKPAAKAPDAPVNKSNKQQSDFSEDIPF